MWTSSACSSQLQRSGERATRLRIYNGERYGAGQRVEAQMAVECGLDVVEVVIPQSDNLEILFMVLRGAIALDMACGAYDSNLRQLRIQITKNKHS